LQAVAFLSLLESQGILLPMEPFMFAVNVFVVAAGSLLLMWIGELITEYGIGNGVSLLILAGILASIPGAISQALFTFTPALIPAYIAFVAIGLAVIWSVVMVAESERSVPIAYARASRGQMSSSGANTYLPIRLLQAGVMPIIFALSLLLLPQMIFTGLSAVGIAGAASLNVWFTAFAANPWAYGAAYFVLVVMFTFFYTSITFEPKRVADNLQKSGAFVPGVRPGRETETYIGNVVSRVTLPGALFLGLVAVIPFIIQGLTGITAILIGGTALLIGVQVLVDLIRKVDAQISLREY
jgi:preprotein translocase subunit SecY